MSSARIALAPVVFLVRRPEGCLLVGRGTEWMKKHFRWLRMKLSSMC